MRNLTDMMGLDVYLSGLDKKELQETQKFFCDKKKYRTPLMSGDVYLHHYHKMISRIQKNADIEELNRVSLKHDIIYDFDFIQDKQYDALVFTAVDQTILWVSSGFKEMTGYTRSFATGKKPNFLQGPNTSPQATGRIQRGLKQRTSTKEVVVNYRKDQTEYLCEIEIFPIETYNGELKGFVAVERQV